MMNEVFRLFGRIAIDSNEAEQSLDRTRTKANKLATTMNTAFSKIGRGAIVCGRAMATGLAVGAAAMGSLVVKSLDFAGQLEQNMGGAEKVFSFCATRMMNVGAEAYKTMGLSQSDFLASANKMGSLFQGMGFSVSDSADMTVNAMQRAADVASIMGISTEDAMEAVAGMAKGNFTMMDNLGVAMNDTALQAYALDKGITKSVSSMSTAEKIGLAYEMFMEQTAYATGNFAAETSTLAGSLAVAKGAWTNFLSGTLTQKSMAEMVKAFVNVADVVINNVNDLLPKLTKGLTMLIQRLTPYIPQMLQDVLPGLIEGSVMLISALAMALPDIIEIIIDELPFLMEQLALAAEKVFPVLQQSFMDMFESIDWVAVGAGIGDLINRLPELLSNVGNVISYLWQTVVWPAIQGLFKAVFGVELPDWNQLGETISNGWKNTVWPAIQDFFKTTFGIELPSWDVTVARISHWWEMLKTKTAEFFSALFGLDFSDYAEDGMPWYQRIADWFAHVMYALGNGLWAIFGIDGDALAKSIENTVKIISDWWEDVKRNIALSLGFTVEPPTHAPGAAHGNTYADWMVLQQDKYADHEDYGLSWEEYQQKHNITPGFATGLDFVPRDNYVARLHYGETVLNKEAAEAWRSGHANGIDYDRLAEAISQHPVAINVDSKTVGVVFAREMSKAIGNRNIQTLMGMGG